MPISFMKEYPETADEPERKESIGSRSHISPSTVWLLLAVLTLMNVLYCSAQVPGGELWKISTPGQIYSSPAIGADGTIYVGSALGFSVLGDTGWLYAISPQGTTNWVFSPYSTVIASPAIGPDGTIYVGSYNGKLYALDRTGSVKWVFDTGGLLLSSPAIGGDGSVYLAAESGFPTPFNRLYALDSDGTAKWVFRMGSSNIADSSGRAQFPSPVIGPDGTIYVGSVDKHLYAIAPSGTTNWIFPFSSFYGTNLVTAATFCSPSLDSFGNIYIGADNGVVYAISPQGVGIWQFRTLDFVESSPAVSADGSLFFGSADGYTYRVDAHGNRKWRTLTGAVSGSPLITSASHILIGSYRNNKVSALDEMGTMIWTFTGAGSIFASPVIGDDGTIYVASGTYLYALYGTNALMQSSWPMFRGNVRHTARSIQRGITNPSGLADGNFSMTVNVETGRTYQVEYSTNLVDWAELTNFVSQTFTKEVIDGTATNWPQRFYRLSTPLR